jgi:hypothetical protein
MTFDTVVKVAARKAPLGKWVVLALLPLQGIPHVLNCPTVSANWHTSYKLFPPKSQLLTVMVLGVLAPLTPPA